MKMKIYDKRRVADLWLIAITVAIALVSIAAMHIASSLLPSDGRSAVVTLDGVEIGRFELSEDTSVPIPSEWGCNTLEIRDGKASVSDADCPDKICAAHFPISMEGESIVCLPHRLVIYIDCD